MRQASSPRLNPAYQKAYAALYGCESDKHSGFRRDQLPDPKDYYRQQFGALPTRNDWLTACCPFHEDHRPSLSVNLVHGGFCCHACGMRGRDVLDFHRCLTGLDFVAAAKALGAWEGS
ncbi:MAG: CHC2 zinc finger domain-containing protein [Pseudomonadota bacterium]|nr:CHC2 zinc finger domain-containing protein [Pseudomonadota bacterium]